MTNSTVNSVPTSTEKNATIASFQNYFEYNKASYGISSWTKYEYGKSHDGISLWNLSSNSIGFDEFELINNFCKDNGYSFSCYARKTESVSGYGGVAVEINIAKY